MPALEIIGAPQSNRDSFKKTAPRQ